MLGRLERDQRDTCLQSIVLLEAKTAQMVPHTLTCHAHSTSEQYIASTHSVAYGVHK